MNRIILLLVMISIICINRGYAIDVSRYFAWGLIYTGSSFPVDTAKDSNNELSDIKYLKRGEATTYNILGLVETGDRGIQKAAKNGEITKIHYIDTSIDKVYIPFGFIPIYVKQLKTIVYGE